MTNREIINNNIKKTLNSRGYSIKWLAEKIGMNPSTLYTYLNRNESKKIDLDTVEVIANALKVSADSLFEGTSIEKADMVNANRLSTYIDAEMAYAQEEKRRAMNPKHIWYYNGMLQGLSLALMYIESEQEKEAEED